MRKPIINPGIINRLKMLFAIVQDGDTATRNIAKGKCIIWKNTPCRAITDISAGDTLSSANLSTDAEGYINSVENNISNLQDGLAIVANGNTHAAISSGQFVYVKNHDTLAEGLYKASAAISVNEALTTSNLTLDGSGGLNALQTDLNDKYTALNSNFISVKYATESVTVSANGATQVLFRDKELVPATGQALFACNSIITGANSSLALTNLLGYGGELDATAWCLNIHNPTTSQQTWTVRIICWYINTNKYNTLS